MLLAQTGEQLQEKERVSRACPRPGRAGSRRERRRGRQSITSATAASSRRLENRPVGPVAKQFGDGAPQVAARLDGAEGQHPADRQGSQAGRQGAYRCPGAAVGPLQVVEADQDRLAQGGLLEQRLDVLQQPVTLLAGGVRIPECGTLEQRLRPPEQRVHQHGQLYGRVAGLGHAVADSETASLRGRGGVLDQAALTESRGAFDQPAGPGPAPQPGQVIVQRSQLVVPAAQRVRHGTVRSGIRARRGPRCGVQGVSAHFGRPILARHKHQPVARSGSGLSRSSPGPGRSSACPFDITRLSLAGARSLGRAAVRAPSVEKV